MIVIDNGHTSAPSRQLLDGRFPRRRRQVGGLLNSIHGGYANTVQLVTPRGCQFGLGRSTPANGNNMSTSWATRPLSLAPTCWRKTLEGSATMARAAGESSTVWAWDAAATWLSCELSSSSSVSSSSVALSASSFLVAARRTTHSCTIKLFTLPTFSKTRHSCCSSAAHALISRALRGRAGGGIVLPVLVLSLSRCTACWCVLLAETSRK